MFSKWYAQAAGFFYLIVMLNVCEAADSRLLWWDDLSPFHVDDHASSSSFVYRIPIPFGSKQIKEMIPSWNLSLEPGETLDLAFQVEFKGGQTRTYQLGRWATGSQTADDQGLRTSFNDQKDEFASVYTDTLVFHRLPSKCDALLSLNLKRHLDTSPVRFFSVCVSDEKEADTFLASDVVSPVAPLDVPTFCQFDYEGGRVWCSPTSITMLMHFWATKLHQPAWNDSVPTTAARVYDPGWPGTGNWPFNTAFAAEHPGMRAFVTRLDSMEQLRHLIARGIPVATSVSYDLLKGKSTKGKNDGHLVVCVGFDASGDPVFNDPAKCPEVRCTYPLEAFRRAWGSSRGTVYVVYPESEGWPL